MEKQQISGEKMKLRTIRFSGLPVKPENLKAYNEEWQTRYDETLAKYSPDMLTIHKELEKLEAELQAKFVQIEANKLPTSRKGWMELINNFEAPIMLARSSEDTNELVLVVMDRPLA
jgi:16S rRNA C967 or C1407 C5-methylase (RsmB/RsmF family)